VPLDPQARAFLDSLIAANIPSIPTLTPAQARQRMIALSNLSRLPEVERVEDRTIEGPGGPLPVRAYVPAGSVGRPAAAYFHGGGWVTGNLETHDSLLRRLANVSRTVMLAVDYRLAPEHPFPAGVDDAWAAARWLSDNAGEFGASTGSIVVCGDSAGGSLAAAVTFRARAASGPKIAAQLLLYPVLSHQLTSASYVEFAEGHLLTKETMAWFWGHYLADEQGRGVPEAAPLCQTDFAGLPPAVIVTAGFDPLRDEGRAYAAKLQEAGVPAHLLEYGSQIHDFLRRAHLFDRAREAYGEIAEALEQAGANRRGEC
jgi:acetyl esterase